MADEDGLFGLDDADARPPLAAVDVAVLVAGGNVALSADVDALGEGLGGGGAVGLVGFVEDGDDGGYF